MRHRGRIVFGWTLVVGMVGIVGSAVALGARMQRNASGVAEAEAGLEILVHDVSTSYARDKKLCGTSLVTDDHPASWRGSSITDYHAIDADEARFHVGFQCLGTDLAKMPPGKNGYSYEVIGDRFIVRAFRAYLYDPEGVLPRYERRGVIADGVLVVDPTLHVVDPGGPSFLGHPSTSLRGY